MKRGVPSWSIDSVEERIDMNYKGAHHERL